MLGGGVSPSVAEKFGAEPVAVFWSSVTAGTATEQLPAT